MKESVWITEARHQRKGGGKGTLLPSLCFHICISSPLSIQTLLFASALLADIAALRCFSSSKCEQIRPRGSQNVNKLIPEALLGGNEINKCGDPCLLPCGVGWDRAEHLPDLHTLQAGMALDSSSSTFCHLWSPEKLLCHLERN